MKKYIFYILMINLISQTIILTPMNRSSSNSSDSNQNQTSHQLRTESRQRISRKQREIEQMRAQDKAVQEAQEAETRRHLPERHDLDTERITSSAAAVSDSHRQTKEEVGILSVQEMRRLDDNLQSIAYQVNKFQDEMKERLERQEKLLAEIKDLLQATNADATSDDNQEHVKK
jgi:hypothetical protein